jgi:hypothetical protein
MNSLRMSLIILLLVTGIRSLPAFHFHGETLVLAEAKERHFPIVAVFLEETGPWSSELKRVLGEGAFRDPVEKEALIWPVSLGDSFEDRAFETAYGVDQCPLILLLDPEGKEFARIPYNRQTPSQLSSEVVGRIEGFDAVCRAFSYGLAFYSEEGLESLYSYAQVLSPPYFAQLIREEGIRRGGGTFFLLEKYAELLQKHEGNHPQVKALKKALLGKDPTNKQGVHRQVALLEWNRRKGDPKLQKRKDKALRPLLRYLSGIGKHDREHAWEIEMQVAQFYFAHGAREAAIEHARRAYALAPIPAQPELVEILSRWQR